MTNKIKLSDFLYEFFSLKDHRRATIKAYRSKIQKFITVIGRDPYLSDISYTDLSRYKLHFREHGHSKAYEISCLRHLQSVISLAINLEYLDSNPFDLIRIPRRTKTPKNVINNKDVDRALHILDKLENERSRRYKPQYFFRTLIITHASIPPRCGQISGLKWNDVDLVANVIKLRPEVVGCKSGVYNVIPIPKYLAKVLSDFKEISLSIHKRLHCSYKFQSSQVFNIYLHRQSSIFKVMTSDSISGFFYRFSVNEGISLSPQLLRHSIATNALKNNVDIKTVQQLLTHQSITSTMEYLHESPQKHLFEAMEIGSLIKK